MRLAERQVWGVLAQIVPTALSKMLQDKDPEKAQRIISAMVQMDKLDIKRLQHAYERG